MLALLAAMLVPAPSSPGAAGNGALHLLRQDAVLITVDPATGGEQARGRLAVEGRTVLSASGLAADPSTGALFGLVWLLDPCLDPERTDFASGDGACRDVYSQEACERSYHHSGGGTLASCVWTDGEGCQGCGRRAEIGLCINECMPPPACAGGTADVLAGAGPDACRQFDGDAGACANAYFSGFAGTAACFDAGGICLGCDPLAEASGACTRGCAPPATCENPTRVLFTGEKTRGFGCPVLGDDEVACAVAFATYLGDPDACVFQAGTCRSSIEASELDPLVTNVCHMPPVPICSGAPERMRVDYCDLIGDDEAFCAASYQVDGSSGRGCVFRDGACGLCLTLDCLDPCNPPICEDDPARDLAGPSPDDCRAFDGDGAACESAFTDTRCGAASCRFDEGAGECRACTADDPDGCTNTCGGFATVPEERGGAVLVAIDPATGVATAVSATGERFRQLAVDAAGTPVALTFDVSSCLEPSSVYDLVPFPTRRLALDSTSTSLLAFDAGDGALRRLVSGVEASLDRLGPTGVETSVPLAGVFGGFDAFAYLPGCDAFLASSGYEGSIPFLVGRDGTGAELSYHLPGTCDESECALAGLAATGTIACPPILVTTTSSSTTTTTSTSTSTTTTTLPNQLLSGRKLVLADRPGRPAKRRMVVLSKDRTLAVDTVDGDPTTGGASLRVVAGTGSFDVVYPLSDGWQLRGRSRAWMRAGDLPIRKVVVTPGKGLRIVGTGAALGHSLVADPGAIAVELRLGARYYCLEFGGESRVRSPRKIVAVDAPVAGRCPTAAP